MLAARWELLIQKQQYLQNKQAMLLEVLTIAAAVINITVPAAVGCLIFYSYLKVKRKLKKIMDPEALLKDLHLETEDKTHDENQDTKRERLSAIVAGGNSKQYLGKELQISDIDGMTAEQINKLYCRYEARLGASMTKTLGNSFVSLYVMSVSKYFNVVNPPKLIEDLEEDPFINHALTSACCELYYRYGMYLAPFTAMLTTVRHIDFSNKDIEVKNIDTQKENEQRS